MIGKQLNELIDEHGIAEILRVMENICYSRADANQNKDDKQWFAWCHKGLILCNAKSKVIKAEASDASSEQERLLEKSRNKRG